MPDNPYFFIKEFSEEEIRRMLVTKIKELQSSKAEVEQLNMKLEDSMVKLEELQEKIILQRDTLKEELRLKNEELLKSERLSVIGQLSARIAHDLRNPISVISNTSKMLRMKLQPHLDAKSEEQWNRLDRAVVRLIHQLEDVLDYVRTPQLKREYYPMSMIFHDVLERIEIPPNVEFHPSLTDATVYCDPGKMEIVFVNLLVNSIQAIDGKEGSIRVDITDNPDENFVLIKVSDSGPGIPEDVAAKIFEPLFTTKQVGTGLGLSSCKSIIMQHGGTIEIADSVEGATFIIRIPKSSDWDGISAGDPNQITSASKSN